MAHLLAVSVVCRCLSQQPWPDIEGLCVIGITIIIIIITIF